MKSALKLGTLQLIGPDGSVVRELANTVKETPATLTPERRAELRAIADFRIETDGGGLSFPCKAVEMRELLDTADRVDALEQERDRLKSDQDWYSRDSNQNLNRAEVAEECALFVDEQRRVAEGTVIDFSLRIKELMKERDAYKQRAEMAEATATALFKGSSTALWQLHLINDRAGEIVRFNGDLHLDVVADAKRIMDCRLKAHEALVEGRTTRATGNEGVMKRVAFECRLIPDNSLPAFAAYMAGEEVEEVPQFLINFSAIFSMCAEHGFDWKEEVSDSLVHELLHLIQHQFGLAFDELDIEGAIDRARGRDASTNDLEPEAT